MKPTYKIIIQFKSKPLLVFSEFTIEEALAMIDSNKHDMVSCQIERMK